jgi:DNA/RNA endonuclease YhcR with UshA esterase domain
MAMDFPNSPTVGQIFSSGSRQWVWTGTTWDSPTADNPSIAAALATKANLTVGVRDTSVATAITGADNGNIVRLTGSTGRIITIDNVLSIGQGVDFLQDGTGQITFAAGSGVTLRSVDNKLKTNKQYSGATVRCVASGIYHLIGDVVA